jgi:predicted PurR-regulated permease PerM
MQHTISTIVRFITYVGCLGLCGLFAYSYKVDPQALLLAVVFFVLAFVVLIGSWRAADADRAEQERKSRKRKSL